MGDADLVLHAGDVSGVEALRGMEAIGTPLAAVHGNVDTPEIRGLLPDTLVVEVAGVRIGLIHDAGPRAGRLPRLHRRFPDVRAVIFGHSHIPLHEVHEGFQIFNPGSPTDRRRQPVHTMGLARVEDGEVSFELIELPLDD
jgi:putative phosphoesterase